MRTCTLVLFIVLIIFESKALAHTFQPDYSDFFNKKRLRFEYTISGNSSDVFVKESGFVQESNWAGSRVNLIDTFRYGSLMLEVYDSATSQLIYSRGYANLFKEWQSTSRAKVVDSIFSESLLMPFPLKTIQFKILERTADINFQEIGSFIFNPRINTCLKQVIIEGVIVKEAHISGPANKKLDIAIVAEGYTLPEKQDFFERGQACVEQFLTCEPYASQKDNLNLYLVFVPSKESGTDNPADSVFVKTALNTSFNTFGSDRYLTTGAINPMRNILAGVLYDQVCVMVNEEKYGGGGIYNYYTIFTSKNIRTEFLLLHEFGHSFASLADEYYTSSVAYLDMFDKDIEPYEPNVTTLVNFKEKWKSLVLDSIPVPTPDTSLYDGLVGVFEGAAYVAKGAYRPARTCTMFSKDELVFCPVCQQAIREMILFYSK